MNAESDADDPGASGGAEPPPEGDDAPDRTGDGGETPPTDADPEAAGESDAGGDSGNDGADADAGGDPGTGSDVDAGGDGTDEATDGTDGADGKTDLLGHVLVPVANPEDAIATARALRPYAVGRVTALHVVEKGEGVPDKTPVEQSEELAAEAFEAVRGRFPDAETRTAYRRDVVEGVLETAAAVDASAIAFRPRKGGRIARLLSGDISERLIQESAIPVVALPKRARADDGDSDGTEADGADAGAGNDEGDDDSPDAAGEDGEDGSLDAAGEDDDGDPESETG